MYDRVEIGMSREETGMDDEKRSNTTTRAADKKRRRHGKGSASGKARTGRRRKALFGWLRRPVIRIRRELRRERIAHLPLGRQRWREGKLYIEKIPAYVASEATSFLTAILRDYLRAYVRVAYSVGNAYCVSTHGEEARMPLCIRAIGDSEDADGDLARWKKMVSDVADAFDEAADLWEEGWCASPMEEAERIFASHREKIAQALQALAGIFQDLNE